MKKINDEAVKNITTEAPLVKPRPNNLSNITEITEEDDAKFEQDIRVVIKTVAITDTVNEYVIYDAYKSKSTCLRCLSCIFSLFRKKPKKYLLREQDLLKEVRLIKQKSYAVVLPPQKGPPKKTLVLDLDETLLHSSFNSYIPFDFKFQFFMRNKYYVSYSRKRFGVEYFILEMSKIFELVLFTAGDKEYAYKAIDMLDSKKKIEHRLYRDSCIPLSKFYLKNLSILGRKMKNIILLENSRYAGLLQLENLLLIESFVDNDRDRELVRLIPFLKHLATLNDVRPIYKKKQQFDSKEIHIKLNPQEYSPCKNSYDGRPKKRTLHVKKNSEVESLVKKEEQADETDCKIDE